MPEKHSTTYGYLDRIATALEDSIGTYDPDNDKEYNSTFLYLDRIATALENGAGGGGSSKASGAITKTIEHNIQCRISHDPETGAGSVIVGSSNWIRLPDKLPNTTLRGHIYKLADELQDGKEVITSFQMPFIGTGPLDEEHPDTIVNIYQYDSSKYYDDSLDIRSRAVMDVRQVVDKEINDDYLTYFGVGLKDADAGTVECNIYDYSDTENENSHIKFAFEYEIPVTKTE